MARVRDRVLVTGFPSLAARKVTEGVLASEDAEVSVLVRPKFFGEADAAIAALPRDAQKRLRVVEGDIASMDLGLSGAEFRALAKETTHVHHVARASYLGVDRGTAEAVNVVGTREILELARACTRLRMLVAYSTARVSGDRTGLVREADLEAGQRFANVVEETSALAEKLLRARMKDVPIAVLRPSLIVGTSSTGEIERFDGPYLLVLLILTSPPDFALPLPGGGELPLNVVPLDHVVNVGLAAARDANARGRTFHVVDPRPLSARRAFELVAKAAGKRGPRGSIPANLTKALLRAPGLERLVKSPRAFLETMVTPVTYAADNTDDLVHGSGLACPPFESYVEKLVEYVASRLREKKAEKPLVEDHDPLV
ncbi:MAG: SDR family oxidoreductase [Polyangiaceae bacterium]